MNITTETRYDAVQNYSTSPGVSAFARNVREEVSQYFGQDFQNTASIGKPKTGALDALYDVFEECCQAGWDGYSAKAVSYETYLHAQRFLEDFPTNYPLPEIAADPDGEISFEWYAGKNRVFSMSIGAGERMSWMMICGSISMHGTEPYFDEIPSAVFQCIAKLYKRR